MTTDANHGGADLTQVENRLDLGAALSARREHLGLTVRDAATKAGVPLGTVSSWFSGHHVPTPALKDAFLALLAVLEVEDVDAQQEWWNAVQRARRTPGRRKADNAQPYKGLDSFSAEDAQWFFGRDDLVSAALQRMKEQPRVPLVVIGPSGSGKSSLLRAGIVAAVQAGRGGLNQLSTELITPGTTPADTLSSLSVSPETLLCIDQFEELWTQCKEERQRQDFLEILEEYAAACRVVIALRADFYGTAVTHRILLAALRDNSLVVGPLSAQQLHACITEPARKAGYIIEDDLVRIITDDLAPRDSADTHDAGSLPLLSHALLNTCLLAKRKRMTVSDYLATGGIRGALQQTAETAYANLSDDQQVAARRVFQRLITVDGPTETRRRAPLAELFDVDDSDDVRTVINAFADQRMLTLARDSVEITHEVLLREWSRLRGWVQDNKDSLVVHRRITLAAQLWEDAGRDDSALLGAGRLEVFSQWARVDNHESELNNLEREYLAASASHHQALADAERRRQQKLRKLNVTLALIAVIAVVAALGAVGAGVYANVQRQGAELARNEALSRELALESRLIRADQPELAAQLALAAYRIHPTVQANTALLDATSVPTPTRFRHEPGSMALAVSPDGSRFVTSTSDGIARVYPLGNPAPEPGPLAEFPALDDGSPAAYAAAFSPDGSIVALGGNGLALWNVAGTSPESIAQIDVQDESIQAVTFSPDGSVLSAGTPDGGVLNWDITNPASPEPLPPITVEEPLAVTAAAVAYNPDGTMLATSAGGNLVKLWDVTDAAAGATEIHSLPLHGDANVTALGVAFSPDGQFLAAPTNATDVRRWDVSNREGPQELEPFDGFDSWVNDVAFSSDGQHLAVGSSDQTAQIRDWDDGSVVARFPTPALVTSVAYTPDGARLIAAADDGTARVWDMPGPVLSGITGVVFQMRYNQTRDQVIVTAGRGDRAVHVVDVSDADDPQRLARVDVPEHSAAGAVSADGQFLAAGTLEGEVLLFDLRATEDAREVGRVRNDDGTLIPSLAVSPDGSLVAAPSYFDARVHVWDVRDPGSPRPLPPLDLGLGTGELIDFSPSGHYLAAGSSASEFKLWRVGEDMTFEEMNADAGEFLGSVPAVRFSHDEELLAAAGGGGDNRVRIYELRGGDVEILSTLVGPRAEITSLDFSPDRSLLSATTGEELWIWDISDPSGPDLVATPASYDGRVNDAVFLGDGSRIAGAGWAMDVRFWHTRPDSAAEHICRHRGTPITADEWTQYVPGVEQFEICS
ncbi:helix-turn-helix domain-containing protein [Hoyosella sp. YIM 151337]|uniref:nSTAND1 domain-containing NTPase n=1 Tax=Hoyosella sp. YIM 151337 TaxID=2992742 RepID=UPI0022365C03|nr:helix-turn-helix domain-containing protein [Hoyosella sp. YIM 151337]MCW4354218.1 helix-turn-helix domain-containing protein [Hoyosella sp. YIM 151337]